MSVARVGRLLVIALALWLGSWARSDAGVTGSISGHVTDEKNDPLAGAKVSVASPSQSLSTQSDTHGFYAVLNLSPDTYSVTASKDGFDTATVYGVTVQTSQTSNVNLVLRASAKTIGKVLTTATSSVVSKTVTGDLYAVNANAIKSYQGSAGGAETLYSQNAVAASLPGITRTLGSGGGYAGNGSLSVRGGSNDQIGFELEGIPLNRGFDAANATSFVTNGLASLEVYTGGEPADAGRSMSGYINEVYRRGTYPGGADLTLIAGSPVYNHTLQADVFGATPDRRFSYYVSTLAVNSDYQWVNRSNLDNTSINVPANDPGCGAFNTELFLNTSTPFNSSSPIDPNVWNLDCSVPHIMNMPISQGAWQSFPNPSSSIRDTVANLHWGIDHNGLQDDLQALYVVGGTGNPFLYAGVFMDPALYFEGTGGSINSSGQFLWPTGFPYTGAVNQPFTGGAGSAPAPGSFGQYTWPSAGGGTGPIPSFYVDSQSTEQSVEKLQYTRSFSSSSFLRFYAYALYSAWNFDQATNGFLGDSFYQLHDNATGYTLQYQNQVNAQNLLRVDADYSKDVTLRYNYASNFFPDLSSAQTITPFPGTNFYTLPNGQGFIGAVACNGPGTSLKDGPAFWVTCVPGTTVSSIGGPFAYWNDINPVNTDVVVADTYKPSDKWLFDLGLRWDHFGVPLMPLQITGPNGVAEQAQNQYGYCLHGFAYAPSEPCFGFLNALQAQVNPHNVQGLPMVAPGQAPWTNVTGSQDFYYLSPRVGLTYTFDPRQVIRFSVGRYVQQPETFGNEYLGAPWFGPEVTVGILNRFYDPLGFTAVHNLVPQDSTNYDLSFEQDLGQGLSVKLTPYARVTRNQILSIPVNPLQPTFVTGYNFGAANIKGAEFLVSKAQPSGDGLGGTLAVTYTDSKIRFERSLGPNVIDVINGTAGPASSPCSGTGIIGYNQCYGTNYALEDPNGLYSPSLVQAPGSTGPSYDVAWVMNLNLDEHVRGFDFTPTFNYQSGNPYGDPQSFPDQHCQSPGGVNLALNNYPGCIPLPKGVSAPYSGGVGPDPYTGQFDQYGSLNGPWWLTMNLGVSHNVGQNTKASFLWTNVFTVVGNHGYAWELPTKNNVLSYGDNSFYTFPLGTSADTGVPTIPQYFGDNYYAYVPSALMPLREFVFSLSFKM
ncbi:MAG: TonB-dependent receptor [Candidatus Eremiobacteraeota bacterium]|nr:TonB-dependent receptor [Candidatus Eremiobacteraeota bacterium]